jgi:hypothetical protein
LSAENKECATVDTKHQNKHLQAKYMAKEDNPKKWNDTTISKQFIERVKIYKILQRIGEIETASSTDSSVKMDSVLQLFYETVKSPIEEIERDEFATLDTVIVKSSSLSFLQMIHGQNYNIQEQYWNDILGSPVQVVTNLSMLQEHKPGGLIFEPYIKNDRMFISIDLNTNESILKSEFLKLLDKQKIHRTSASNASVTATPTGITSNTFIPIMGFRIMNMWQKKPWSKDEEIKFIVEKKKFRRRRETPQQYDANDAANRIFDNLQTWLSNPAHITKIIKSIE